MNESGAFATRPFPLWWPSKRAWRERLAALDGSVPKLAAEVLGRAGIRTIVRQGGELLQPEQYPWNNTDRGTIFVGCHRGKNEPPFLAGLLGQTSDKRLRAFAKPYAFLPQGLAALAKRPDGTLDERICNTLLPVVSQRIAAGSKPKISLQKSFWWAGMRRPLPTFTEVKANTERVFARASAALEQGEAMLIFPTGRVADALKTPWRPGVGRLAAACHEFADRVDIVPFRFDDYPWLSMARAVMFNGAAPPDPVEMHIAPPYTVAELMQRTGGSHLGAVALATEIHSHYVTHFGAQPEAP